WRSRTWCSCCWSPSAASPSPPPPTPGSWAAWWTCCPPAPWASCCAPASPPAPSPQAPRSCSSPGPSPGCWPSCAGSAGPTAELPGGTPCGVGRIRPHGPAFSRAGTLDSSHVPPHRLRGAPARTAPRPARLPAIVFWGHPLSQMGIILSGAAVRLTASGLACSPWPNCKPGQFTPELTMESGIHPFVEFGNRTLTGVLSISAVAVLLVTWRWLGHKGPGFRRLAWVPLIGTAVQALMGAFVVWFDLHPGLVSPHFLISPLLGAASMVLLVRLYDGDGHVRLAVPARAVAVFVPLAVVGFVVLVLGTVVTGTGPHS